MVRGPVSPPRGSVYLIGFMRSGKTTVGRLLAAELGRPFVDLDAEVERAAGRTIADIWASEGEGFFRYRENEALLRLAGSRAVIATGGGTTVSRTNRELLQATGLVLWLRASFGVIWSRAKGERSSLRPLWSDEGSLRELLRSRERTYSFANHTVRTSAGPRERGGRARARPSAGEEQARRLARRLANVVLRSEGRA